MFCRSCQTSIKAAAKALKLALPGDKNYRISNIVHDSLPSFCRSVMEGCFTCRQLWAFILNHYGSSEGEFVSSEYEGDFSEREDTSVVEIKTLKEWWNRGNSPIQLMMYSSELDLTLIEIVYGGLHLILSPSTNKAGQDAPMRPDLASEITSTAGNPDLWSHWFRTCSESHVKCHELDHNLQPFTPDRLVEIFTDDDGNSFSWRLVCRTDIGNVPYLTLSHCWGSSRHTRLTIKNYLAFLEFSPYSELPKTFRHAFLITFSLGFRFLWIDSLCIFQDDLGDWKAQASMMGSVYKNACCNIAATWAADGHGGCFRTSKPRMITLDLGLDKLTEYQVSLRTLYYDDLMEAPLNNRGWVAQERFLARKQLSFAKSQVYWECRELVASEQFPTGIPEKLRDLTPYNQAPPPTGKPTLDFTTEAELCQAWAALVDFYSDCTFTRLSDKMIALAGLAEEMKKATEDVYLAGLWKKDLQRQLCWIADIDVRRRVNRSTTPIYLAPTWSWANVDGPIMSDMNYYSRSIEYASCIEILDASIRSEHFSELHSFVSSNLVLRGVTVWAPAMRAGKSASPENDDGWELQLTDLGEFYHSCIKTGIQVSIMWDENMFCSEVNPERWPSFLEERRTNLLCMFVAIEYPFDVQGLLLRRLPGAIDEIKYVRMGVFHDYSEGLFNILSMRLKNPPGHSIVEKINLDDAGLADLVHTVTVV